MNAHDEILKSLLATGIQLQIPIYQRTYDWGKQHCKQLYDDIVKAGRSGRFHFIGAVTLSTHQRQPAEIRRFQVIDGQQRITSVMLLLRALNDTAGVSGDLEVKINNLLFNAGKSNDEYHHKLVLATDDNPTFREIMKSGKTEASGNIKACFNYFKKWLAEDGTHDLIWRGVQALTIVSIVLDKQDSAQEIFESMNSTGLNLTEADKIQNYMLMHERPDWSERMYRDHWRPLEQQFGEGHADLDAFFQNYMAMRGETFVKKSDIYKKFKEYMEDRDREEEIREIIRYSKHYAKLIGISSQPNYPLKDEIKYVRGQDTHVADPLLLKVLADHDLGAITANDAKQVFLMVGSYHLRSRVCGAHRALDKVFPELIGKIDANQYAKSVETALMSRKGANTFPRDDIFKERFVRFSLYSNAKLCKYVLVNLEHRNDKERVIPDDLTIEHVMPQELNDEWKTYLGEKYEDIYEKYIHTIGNLALTAFNSKLGDMPFSKKQEIYKHSKVTMTKKLANLEKWDEETITARAKRLADETTILWSCPEGYDRIAVVNRGEDGYERELEEEHLEGKNTVDLWNGLKEAILSACDGTKFRMNKNYGTIRLLARDRSSSSVICNLESLLNRIHITYSTNINNDIIQPSNFVKDVSRAGHYGYGDLRSTIASEDDIDMVVNLVKRIWQEKK